MNKKQREWVEYLRTPGLKKAKRKLESYLFKGHRCCLGHACHLFGAEKRVDERVRKIGFSYKGSPFLTTSLPFSLAEELGIFADGCFKESVYMGGKECGSIAVVNDTTDLTLSEIADVIEEQLKRENFL